MKVNKKSFKIFQIWVLFMFSSFSFFWLISLSNPKTTSFINMKDFSFWEIKETYAENEEFWEDDEEFWEWEEDDNYNKRNLYLDSTNKIILNPWITTSLSQNNSNSWSTKKVCKTITETVYDTVTSASWTKSQIPRNVSKEVCEIIAINPVITKTDSWTTTIYNKPIIQKQDIIKSNTISYKAPNWKMYSLLNDWISISIKKSDWTFAKISFETFWQAIDYLNINAIPKTEQFKAPNWKIYTIFYEFPKVIIKKSDWTFAKQTFLTYAEAKVYLNKNSLPIKIVAKPKSIQKVVTTKNTNNKQTSTITTPVVNKTQPATVVTPSVTIPKVDTTTKAS